MLIIIKVIIIYLRWYNYRSVINIRKNIIIIHSDCRKVNCMCVNVKSLLFLILILFIQGRWYVVGYQSVWGGLGSSCDCRAASPAIICCMNPISKVIMRSSCFFSCSLRRSSSSAASIILFVSRASSRASACSCSLAKKVIVCSESSPSLSSLLLLPI